MQTFGDQLHSYTIVDAINDKNVLPFRVDYIQTMKAEEEITDEMVWDINREKAMMDPKRIQLVTSYILEHFDQKTYRGDKTYIYNTLVNIKEVASAKRDEVEEIKRKQRISGFNSIFAVSSVPMAKLYYREFQKQMADDPTRSCGLRPSSAMAQMKGRQMVFWMKKIRKIPLLLTSRPGSFWKKRSRIITKCSIQTMTPPARNSRIIIKTYHCV